MIGLNPGYLLNFFYLSGVIFRKILLSILACLNLKLPETRHSNLPQTMDDAIKLEEFALPEIPDRSRIRRNTENNITLM